jgi:hypothetical protein
LNTQAFKKVFSPHIAGRSHGFRFSGISYLIANVLYNFIETSRAKRVSM